MNKGHIIAISSNLPRMPLNQTRCWKRKCWQ